MKTPFQPQYWTIEELAKGLNINEETIRGYLHRKILTSYKLLVEGKMRIFIDYNQLQRRICRFPIQQTNVSFEEWMEHKDGK